MKNFFRKIMVGLKRRPQLVCIIALCLTFIYYSLNLTDISDTTAKIQGKGMGLFGFCTMLFSILSIVSCLNAFPTRKKANIPMLVLTYVMLGIVIFADIKYRGIIIEAATREENPIVITESTIYIYNAAKMLYNHVIFLGVSIALIATKPLYAKLFRKVNTSVNVEDFGKMEAIDISEE